MDFMGTFKGLWKFLKGYGSQSFVELGVALVLPDSNQHTFVK